MKTVIGLFVIFSSTAFSVERVENYDWLTLGEKSGAMTVSYKNDTSVNIDFSFNDRGRGPNTKEIIQFNDQGMPISYQVSGNSYMGAIVKEQFSLDGKNARWESDEESGSLRIDQASAYVAANASPATNAILIQTILKQKNKQINLLPAGTATVKELLRTTVNNGEEQKVVKLMALNGLGFTPTYMWFDEADALFGVSYGWMGMTPTGWSGVIDQLQKLQDETSEKYSKEKSALLTTHLAGSTLIENVNILDVKKGKLKPESAVLIEAGKIKAIGKKAYKSKADKVIDGKGKTLMPGMWDMHTHIGLTDGLLQIAAGVTSVRDLANNHDDLIKTIAAFDSAGVIGPRVYKAGFIDKSGPFAAPTGKLADNLQQALEMIDWYAERGYPQIKIYSSIEPEWVSVLAQRIHKHGMKLSGHIPSFMTTEQAVKDGFDEIQHINMLFLNFLAGPTDDTRTPVRFTLVGEKAGTLDLGSKKVTDFIKLLKKNKIVVDPTVTIFNGMFLDKAGELNVDYAMIADHMPANVRRGFLSGSLDINDSNEEQYKNSAAALLKMLKLLHDNGIQLVAGTDAIAGFTLHRELELYAKAGIPNKDVLKIATLDSATVVGKGKTSGSIKVGKDADLVLIDGNPLENISAIRKVYWSIKGEYYYDSSKLYQSIGVKPFVN